MYEGYHNLSLSNWILRYVSNCSKVKYSMRNKRKTKTREEHVYTIYGPPHTDYSEKKNRKLPNLSSSPMVITNVRGFCKAFATEAELLIHSGYSPGGDAVG